MTCPICKREETVMKVGTRNSDNAIIYHCNNHATKGLVFCEDTPHEELMKQISATQKIGRKVK